MQQLGRNSMSSALSSLGREISLGACCQEEIPDLLKCSVCLSLLKVSAYFLVVYWLFFSYFFVRIRDKESVVIVSVLFALIKYFQLQMVMQR